MQKWILLLSLGLLSSQSRSLEESQSPQETRPPQESKYPLESRLLQESKYPLESRPPQESRLLQESRPPLGGLFPGIKKMRIADLNSYIALCEHPLILNFWATYCIPCITEIPYFQRVAASYQALGVELLLVNLDPASSYPDRIAAFARAKDFLAPIIWLDETNSAYYRPLVDKTWSGGMPCSLFINNKTHYRQFFDRQLTGRQVEPAIKAMLK
jgi:thiol-disulfide isomerase/thioredoxin